MPALVFRQRLAPRLRVRRREALRVIEIEVQNETHQTQERLKFVAVPRIGEGIRLLEPDGFWASYDVVDLWYQKAEFGDIWVPYLHVRMTPSEPEPAPVPSPLYDEPGAP